MSTESIIYTGDNPIPHGKTRIEKIWECNGLRCMVVMRYTGTRCGYVAVPPGHPLHGVELSFSDDRLDDLHERAVHGLSFCGKLHPELNGGQDLWQFGYDCNHYGDNADESVIERNYEPYYLGHDPFGHHVSFDECVYACERMAGVLSGTAKKQMEVKE